MNKESTIRLTAAQALLRFLKNQRVEQDGKEQPFFSGCFRIFGHGNVGGIGQALQENLDFRYYQCRNEQAMVHTTVAYGKIKNRLQTFNVHFLYWPRRHKHGYRRRDGHDQSSSGSTRTWGHFGRMKLQERIYCP